MQCETEVEQQAFSVINQPALFKKKGEFVFDQVLVANSECNDVKLDELCFNEFSDCFKNLVEDVYMKDGDTYRYRRFSEFRLTIEDEKVELELLPHRTFNQSKDLNSYSGGYDRVYPPLEEHIISNPFLHQLMVDVYLQLPESERTASKHWEIGVHLYRIVGKEQAPGFPAPEGAHQDGHEFTSITLINRSNVVGGESIFLDFDKKVRIKHVLSEPIETAIFNDRKGLHDVTPIRPENINKIATRDVCGFSLNPIK